MECGLPYSFSWRRKLSTVRNDPSIQLRRQREDFRQREESLIKKHHKNSAQQTVRHQNELEEVKKSYRNQIDKVKKQTREALTEREKRFQSDIAELKDVQKKRLTKMSSDRQIESDHLRKTAAQELANQKKISRNQKNLLVEQNEENIKKLKEGYSEASQVQQKQQRKAQVDQRKSLLKAHEEQTDILRNTSNEKIGELQEQVRNYKDQKDRMQDSYEQRLYTQKTQSENDTMDTLQTEKMRHNQALSDNRMVLKAELEKLRDKYMDAVSEEKAKSEASRQYVKESTQKRQDDVVNALERRATNLKKSKTEGFEKLRQQYEIQRDNLVSDYQKRFEGLEKDNSDTLKVVNDRSQKEVDELNRKNSRVMREQNLFYLDKFSELERRFNEEIDTKDTISKNQKAHLEQRTEDRVKRLTDKFNKEKQSIEDHFLTAISDMKQTFQNRVQEAREAQAHERNRIVKSFNDQLRENEIKNEERYQSKMRYYEDVIHKMAAQHQRDVNALENKHMQMMKQQTKLADLQLSSSNAHFEQKVGEIREAQQAELDRINRRHHEELEKILMAVKES